MTMMLVIMFASAGFGLFVKRWGRRESLLCAAIGVSLTLIYFFHPSSMT